MRTSAAPYTPLLQACVIALEISGGISVPDNYVKHGFDQTIIDLVVFIVVENNSADSYVAAASPCIKTRRPIYGYITFNTAYIIPAGKKAEAFH